MAKQDTDSLRKESFDLIERMQFGKAISIVSKMLKDASLHDKVQEVEHIRDTYKYMTRYMLDGVEDRDETDSLAIWPSSCDCLPIWLSVS